MRSLSAIDNTDSAVGLMTSMEPTSLTTAPCPTSMTRTLKMFLQRHTRSKILSMPDRHLNYLGMTWEVWTLKRCVVSLLHKHLLTATDSCSVCSLPLFPMWTTCDPARYICCYPACFNSFIHARGHSSSNKNTNSEPVAGLYENSLQKLFPNE